LYNRAAARILGIPAADVLNQDYDSALESMRLPVQALVAEVKSSGETLNRELDIRPAGSGATLSLNLTLTPLRDMDRRTLGVAMVIDDITEEKRLESVRRYLPPSLVDQIRDLDAAQRPQQRDLTVLFADLRGFTTYSELREPEWLIEVVNGYFDLLVKAISRYQGFTDKFMGDAVMALFNSPLNPQDDHVHRAIQTALMIQDSLAVYRQDLPAERHLHFGIGIHTGSAVVGNVGSELRKDYSAIGDAVNLAKRLQENARPDQILISEEVRNRAGDWITVEKLQPLKVKGRKAAEQVYNLEAASGV
jgi:PAS domain S-box-containing protein